METRSADANVYQTPTWEIRLHLLPNAYITRIQVYHLGVLSNEQETTPDGRTPLPEVLLWAHAITGNSELNASHLTFTSGEEPESDSDRLARLVQAVRTHAQDNYDTGGWDFVVETWEDKELIREIGDAPTPEEAIRRIGESIKVQHEYREDNTPREGIHY